MGSVSSLISGGSLHDKHCKAFESRGKKPSHLQKFIRQQDGLLKFGGGHEPIGNGSRCETTEDFFYISISQSNGLTATGKRKSRASGPGPQKDVPINMDVKGPPPTLVPISGHLEQGSKRNVVRPTAVKAAVPRNGAHLNGPLGNQMEAKLASQGSVPNPGNPAGKQQGREQKQASCSGTLSDSGRNSMSSLPTHSTGCSRGPEPTGAATTLRKRFGGSAQHIGSIGGILRNGGIVSTSEGGNKDLSSNHCSSRLHSAPSGSRSVARDPVVDPGGRGVQEPLDNGKVRHCGQGPGSPERREGANTTHSSRTEHGECHLLQIQVSQLQQEKQQLRDNFAQLLQQCNSLKAKCKTYEREQTELSPTLEEIKWEVCQKSGVISLLKQQLKDSQTELANKTNEVLTLRNQAREARGKLSSREQRVEELQGTVQAKARELEVCENELQRMRNAAELLREKVGLQEQRIRELKRNSVSWKEASCGGEIDSRPEPALSLRQSQQGTANLQGQVDKLKAQLEQEKQRNQALSLDSQKERLLWCAEKERVIEYQKQLQQNYLRTRRQNLSLERTVQQLSVQLEARDSVERVGQGADSFEVIVATAI
ncbi:leucine zipper putative tumor suppressor 1-like [Leucoraja erinacea]|uniref:leucine zipper putative tumor suppressor 1-like n=1 Tax=Leucoraja erinaceus TaxID=7782 RepID=UPI0024548761|nr:leucine zipper putative tumor suppressor 1-like [Leucoraja erinacea]